MDDEDNNSNHDINTEDDRNELQIKQGKEDGDNNLDIIERFLENGSYPVNMKGRPDMKANLRKKCKKYILNNGVLKFRYCNQKAEANSKAPAYVRVIKKTDVRKQANSKSHPSRQL